jgi:hypothetical protein
MVAMLKDDASVFAAMRAGAQAGCWRPNPPRTRPEFFLLGWSWYTWVVGMPRLPTKSDIPWDPANIASLCIGCEVTILLSCLKTHKHVTPISPG